MIDKFELKTRARRIIGNSRPSAFTAALIYILVIYLFSYLSASLLNMNVTEADLQKAMSLIQSGRIEAASSFMSKFTPSVPNTAVDFLLQLAAVILRAGFIIFIINTVRRQEPCFGNLLDGFNIVFRVLLLYILEWIIIAFFAMLFIVPGFIAFYRYRMAIYLLIDNPDMSVFECLRKSAEMMKGRKRELFSLDMSMLGWLLLQCFIPLAGIYTEPYTKTVYVLYYQRLAGIVDYLDMA